jgi:uncharacterized protein
MPTEQKTAAGSSGSKMSPAEAGRKGGEATSRRRGSGFYAEIGRKGGRSVSRNRGHMSQIGHRGGVSRGRRTP